MRVGRFVLTAVCVLASCIGLAGVAAGGDAGTSHAAPASPSEARRVVAGGVRPVNAGFAGLLPASVDPAVPSPESVLGRPVGQGAARYADVERYLHALAEASPLVKIEKYATSHEGRSLSYLTITSAANHSRLDQIQADNAKLADPRKLGGVSDADRIIDAMPAVAWLAYSIHGDEMSGTDASMLVAYSLAAGTDEATKRLRDEVVIHVDPSMNPDGRERYLGQLEPLTGKVLNTDYQAMQYAGLWSAGRGNHYLFDLNRDWLPMVHPETRGRAAVMIEWNPHLVIDAHEMGPLDTYLFDPPREPFNVNLSESNMRWRRLFSGDQARAFDRHGWSYYTQEWYEEWYPGYTNAWANLLGAVGLLYEQARVSGGAIKQASGRVLTYEQAVAHQLASSLANLETLRANRREILRDYFEDRRWAVTSAGDAGEKVFVAEASTDSARFNHFRELLERHGIEFEVSESRVVAKDAVSLWGEKADRVEVGAGSLVARVQQPHRRLLRSILQFDPRMSDKFLQEERRNLETHQGTRVYDVTAWNLSMAYGLEAYWADSASSDPNAPRQGVDDDPFERTPAYGYLVDGRSSDVYAAIVRILEGDGRVRVAQKPFSIGNRDYKAGTLLLRRNENPTELGSLLKEAAEGLSLAIFPAETALSESGPDLGGNEFQLLVSPRVALASQWPISSTSFGSIWHLLDARIGLRCSPINTQSIGHVDMRKYNVLILPNAWGGGGLGAILNDATRAQLRSWIEAGGTLIAVGGSAAFIADEGRKLSSVRLRHEVLDKLKIYEEAVGWERAARKILVDPTVVWGEAGNPPAGAARFKPAPPAGDSSAENADESATDTPHGKKSKDENAAGKSPEAAKRASDSKDVESLKRHDAWSRIFSPGGVFVRAELNSEHWLCFGLDERLPILFGGSDVFMSSHPVATPVRLGEEKNLRLAGLLWPEARERMADSAYATVERVGRGQVILFAGDPSFRGYMEGASRLLLNAVILGPGMGTSTAVPW